MAPHVGRGLGFSDSEDKDFGPSYVVFRLFSGKDALYALVEPDNLTLDSPV
jgi:hypothetical protein